VIAATNDNAKILVRDTPELHVLSRTPSIRKAFGALVVPTQKVAGFYPIRNEKKPPPPCGAAGGSGQVRGKSGDRLPAVCCDEGGRSSQQCAAAILPDPREELAALSLV
jgi:hypothetical protein